MSRPEERLEQTQEEAGDVMVLEESTPTDGLRRESAPAAASGAREGLRAAGANMAVTEAPSVPVDELQARADLPGDVVAKATNAEQELPVESVVTRGQVDERTPDVQDIVGSIAGVAGAAVAYAGLIDPRTPADFYVGHSHDVNGDTVGAPAHSGGTNSAGCHNASVPYHCH